MTILRPSSIATSMLSLTAVSIKQEPTRKEMGWLPLNRLVGIAKVKEQVEQFVAMAEFSIKNG